MDMRTVGIWTLRGVVAAAFLAAGGAKLAGVPAIVDVFEQVGLGQWFRYVTGAIEIVGGIIVLVPALTIFGAALLACTMVGATVSHLTVVPGSPVPALVLLALCLVLVWLHRDRLPSDRLARA